jgi:uncharacterized protein
MLAIVPAAAGMAGLAAPAQAQMSFSDGYKFLDAVKKKDGQKVEDALNEPGTTIVNTRDVTTGESALHIVAQRRDLTWLQYLTGKGANVNARDGRGQTPLQIASGLGWREGVEFLVSNKARLDETNNSGETPLISAVHQRDLAMMRILLEAGADPDRADNSGRSARDYATLDGKSSMMLQAITNYAKKGGKDKPVTTYGPAY